MSRKNYTKEEKKERLEYLESHTFKQTTEKYGVSGNTLNYWKKEAKNEEWDKLSYEFFYLISFSYFFVFINNSSFIQVFL